LRKKLGKRNCINEERKHTKAQRVKKKWQNATSVVVFIPKSTFIQTVQVLDGQNMVER